MESAILEVLGLFIAASGVLGGVIWMLIDRQNASKIIAADHGAKIEFLIKQSESSEDRDKLILEKIDDLSSQGKDIAVLKTEVNNIHKLIERDCA